MIKIRRNCKKIERRKLGIKRNSKTRRKLRLRNFAAKRGSLRKSHSAAKKISRPLEAAAKIPFLATKMDLCCETISQPLCTCCENFRSCENPPWHTSAISQPGTTVLQLRIGCDFFHAWRATVSQPRHHFEGCFTAAKPPYGTRAPSRRVVRLFRSCEMGCELDA